MPKNIIKKKKKKTLNWVLGGAKYHELKAWKNMCVHDVCLECFSSSYFWHSLKAITWINSCNIFFCDKENAKKIFEFMGK